MPTRSPAFSTVSPARSWNVTETVNRPYCWASSGAGSTSPVRLGKVLEGEIQELVDALVTHAQTEALKAQASS